MDRNESTLHSVIDALDQRKSKSATVTPFRDLVIDTGAVNGLSLLGQYQYHLERTILNARSPYAKKTSIILNKRIGKLGLNITEVLPIFKMGKRTLQRYLSEEGYRFEGLRDQVRFHYAVNYLMLTNVNVEDIVPRLGYKDKGGFYNAFRRWTAMTPKSFRNMFADLEESLGLAKYLYPDFKKDLRDDLRKLTTEHGFDDVVNCLLRQDGDRFF